MKQPDDAHLLAAFADGELDGEANLRVLEMLAADPAVVKKVAAEQRLRKACAKAMAGDEGSCCPAALRERIEAMAGAGDESGVTEKLAVAGQAGAGQTADPSPVLARIGRWLPAAVAAMLLIGAWVVASSITQAVPPADAPITLAKLNQFDNRHTTCGTDPGTLKQHDLFPTGIDQLDDTLADMLTSDLSGANLDLSSLGYDYQIAGVCPVPGGSSAVHILYKNPDGQSISLWVKPYDAQPALEPDTPYLTQRGSLCPIVVWRQRDTVFYLMANSLADLEKARPQIHLASAL